MAISIETITNRRIFFLMVGMLLIAVLAIIYVLAQTQDSQIAKISESPEDFEGQNVDVSGEISSTIGSRAVTIRGPGTLNDEVLVISKNPLTPVGGRGIQDSIFREDERVRVQGELRKFNLEEIEGKLNNDLVDEQFENWNGKAVIIAESIHRNF